MIISTLKRVSWVSDLKFEAVNHNGFESHCVFVLVTDEHETKPADQQQGQQDQAGSRVATPKSVRPTTSENAEDKKQNHQGASQGVPLNPSKAVQTAPLRFGPVSLCNPRASHSSNPRSQKKQPVTANFLLGEVRPWGPPSKTLPKKGLGMYLATNKPVKTTQQVQQVKGSNVPTLPSLTGNKSGVATPVPPLSVG